MLQTYLQLLDSDSDRQNFEQLYITYRKLMHWIAKDILHDDNLAEDAVHDAFLRIIKNFHKIREIDSKETKNFIAVIVKNVALSMLQNRKTDILTLALDEEPKFQISNQGNEDFYDFFSAISSVTDTTLDEINKSEIMQAILSLPDTSKEILYLYGYMGYSLDDIASSLNIAKNTAYKRLQRARALLAEKLKEEN